MKKNKDTFRLEYQVVDLGDVIRYFAKDFTPKDESMEVQSYTYYVDPVQGKVVFQLIVDKKAVQK